MADKLMKYEESNALYAIMLLKEDSLFQQRFPRYFKEVDERSGGVFFITAEWITLSEVDSIHMDPDDHKVLMERLSEVIKGIL